MATRSLNKVQLIGNLTRDPELRYTPSGTAVCTFGLATNRGWTTDSGEKKEEVEFHRVVTWNKLAELCAQLLFKGRRIYVEGRIQTRSWTAQDNTARQTTEIVASDMILLDNKRAAGEESESEDLVPPTEEATPEISELDIPDTHEEGKVEEKETKKDKKEEPAEDEVKSGDIPF